MSFIGQNPKSNTYTFTPQSVDPSSPTEGDLYFSDGTPRDAGLWVYASGAWSQVSTGATLSTLDNLTLTPQDSVAEAAPPLSTPVEGLTYRADGSGRTEGIWTYQNGGWVQITGARYQEFYLKDFITVRVATTANLSIASDLDNGSIVDGVTLVTGDLVLVKNQTTASENGVYEVPITGAASRYSGADTFDKLNRACVHVNNFASQGATNKYTQWFQTATLTSLSDNQVWANTPATYTFTVPNETYILNYTIGGAGGGGGGGFATGAGSATDGSAGTDTSVGTLVSVKGASGGLRATSMTAAVAGSTSDTYGFTQRAGGTSGGVSGGAGASGQGGERSIYATTATSGGSGTSSGSGAGGGGGGANGRLIGGNGGNGVFTVTSFASFGSSAASGSCAGGGGGGGGGNNGGAGGAGGNASQVLDGTLKVTPGDVLTITVGVGGLGGRGSGAISAGNGGRGGSGYVRLSW